MWGSALMGGVLALISVPLKDTTHTCDEGCRRGGHSMIFPQQGWVLKNVGTDVDE